MCYVISACLIGENCKYKGDNNLHQEVKKIFDESTSIAVCPEILGGLGVPRHRTEICEGSGEEVLCGKGKVINKKGEDVTIGFVRGAQRAFEMAKEKGLTKAIVKARSPSCGFGMIYDGTFSGALKKGNGVFTQMLCEHGFVIKTEEDV